MLFTQIEFAFFLIAVFSMLLISRNNRYRKCVLLIASAYFYAYWDARFLLLVFGCTFINHAMSRRIQAKRAQKASGLVAMVLAVSSSLGCLAFFKYFNFFAENISLLMGLPAESIALKIILPVGISFFTFQALSHTIDTYRGLIDEQPSLMDFALYVCFFPQLVAGPVVRASEFLPQLAQSRPLTLRRLGTGAQIFCIGFFKKCFVADNLAQHVDLVFANPSVFSGITIGLAVFGYAIQIYCDFSGYSDMAIGVARMLGYDFSMNFNLPYCAVNPTDFWRRWHISLSTWLRDYLYIPLGGNRCSELRQKVNLMITMTLGGLWHGAAWTFVLWGAWHGMALVIYHIHQKRISNRILVPTSIAYAMTMAVVLVGWILFRATSLDDATLILSRMLTMADGVAWHPAFTVVLVVGIWVWHVAYTLGYISRLRLDEPRLIPVSVCLTCFWMSVAFRPNVDQAFIYFQF